METQKEQDMSENTPAKQAEKVTKKVTHPTLTVATAKREQAATDLRQIAKTVADSKRQADRVVGDVMWTAALTTHNVAEVSRAIGKDGVWSSQADYAKAIGFGPAYVTRLKRLGRAAVVLGVTKSSREWTFLASYADRAPVGKAIADATDSADLKRRLKPLMAEMAEHGKITTGARVPQIASEKDGEKDGEKGAEKSTTPPTLGDVRAMLRDVETAIHGLSPVEAEKAERALVKMAAGLAKRRETLAGTVAGEVVNG